MMDQRPEWFAAKRYGFGSGLPIAWQGWAVMVAFLVTVFAASAFVVRSPVAAASIIVTATAFFIVVCAKTTRGGWRWRWGDRD